MKQYHDGLKAIIQDGQWQENRTGIKCKSLPGYSQRYDLADGFPAVTTKRLAWKSVKGELAGFLKGAQSAAEFRELGCKIWDQNANENQAWLNNPFRKGEDDLGPVYGAQWRRWKAYKTVNYADYDDGVTLEAQRKHLVDNKWEIIAEHRIESDAVASCVYYKEIDQIEYVVNEILHNPTNRRILFHGWNWAELDQMALPPCHLLYQFIPYTETRELNMTLTIRSNDAFLGQPFNIASAALLLSIVARLTGYTPRILFITSNDFHIYENHMEQVQEQLIREPRALPTLKFNESFPTFEKLSELHQGESLTAAVMGILDNLNPEDFELENYDPWGPIAAPMAV